MSRPALAQSARFSEVPNFEVPQGSPSKETTQALKDELLFQRSTQAERLRTHEVIRSSNTPAFRWAAHDFTDEQTNHPNKEHNDE